MAFGDFSNSSNEEDGNDIILGQVDAEKPPLSQSNFFTESAGQSILSMSKFLSS
jgi:hypothetical protein